MREWVDTHCHLDDRAFDADRSEVLAEARAAGVVHQVVPAVAAAGWDALRALCRREPGLHPAYGLHPICLAQHRPEHLDRLRDRLREEPAGAVGECGLDFHCEGLDAGEQRHYFRAQLEIAAEFDRPVVVHARKAVEEVLIALRSFPGLRGVVHSWSGSEEQARQLFKAGFHLGIGGPVTYPRAQRLRRIVAAMPIEFLLLETDAPDQPLCGRQGRRNSPSRVPEVAAVVAGLRNTDLDALADATTRNARAVFGLR